MVIRNIYRFFKNQFNVVDVQKLLDGNHIRMTRTKEYLAPDRENKMSFTYKFKFDNPSRKRRFLAAVAKYPPQKWDAYVRWMDEINQLDNEIIVEAHCLVPPEEFGSFRSTFEGFVAKGLVLKDYE